MTAERMNTLGNWLGVRDVPALTRDCLREEYGFSQADVMVLFGGSILCGVDVLADAMRAGVAKKYVIVGGAGHTTQTLRDTVHKAYPNIDTDGRTEAEIFADCLRVCHGLSADALETKSTNCGNNITNLLTLLEEEKIECRSVILTQDATMQRRMAATLRKYRPDITVISYAAYSVRVTGQGDALAFGETPRGMWSVERYAELLMGEIPRLTDDENGYGPNGKGFIAHEDVPEAVMDAFLALKRTYAVREANSAYAGRTPTEQKRDALTEALKEKYKPVGMIVYGSFADGSNNEGSDFDALIVTADSAETHDHSRLLGTELDVFVYPESKFEGEYDIADFLQVWDGHIAVDRDGRMRTLRDEANAYIREHTERPVAETEHDIAWCRKMLERTRRADAEGLYRLYWLIRDSLEIYCAAKKEYFFGPKKVLGRMEREDAEGAKRYGAVLRSPNADTLEKWIEHIEQTYKQMEEAK